MLQSRDGLPYGVGMPKSTKNELSAEELAAARKLKALWESKRRVLGLSQTTVATEFEMTQGGVSNYLNGHTALNAAAASKFAKRLGVSVEDFAPMKVLRELAKISNGLSEDAGEYFVVKHFQTKLSAGAGASEGGDQKAPLVFRRDWAASEGLDPNELIVVGIKGDSMSPQLVDGDSVLVRTDVKNIIDGLIYAINEGDEQRVKRIFRPRKNEVLLTSDNGAGNPPELLKLGDLDEFSVIGQVWTRIGRVT